MEALSLPVELTIYAVAELRPSWLDWLDRVAAAGEDAAEVRAADVAEVDGAGLQLLLALRRSMHDRRIDLRLREPSPALRTAIGGLGLGEDLGGRS